MASSLFDLSWVSQEFLLSHLLAGFVHGTDFAQFGVNFSSCLMVRGTMLPMMQPQHGTRSSPYQAFMSWFAVISSSTCMIKPYYIAV